MVDNQRFKTPFFDIEVGDAKGNNMIPLPPSLKMLVEKIEITENFIDCHHSFVVSITFIEGSREPFKQNAAVSAEDLYPSGGQAGQGLTNAPGMLTDLKFDQLGNSAGFNAVASPGAVGAVLGGTYAGAAQDIIAGLIDGAAPDEDENKVTTKPEGPIKYVFEEKNQIKVTWGYKEDTDNKRTIRTRIAYVRSTFPENDHPRLVVSSLPIDMSLDQITPTKGVVFSTKDFSGNYEDMKVGDIIKKVCSDAGMKCVVSDNLFNEKVDKHHATVWAAGQSFKQFITGLAKRTNSYFGTIMHPQTGEDYVIFISRTDFESKPIVDTPGLFTYKGEGSIVRSITLNGDFYKPVGAAQTGVDDEGTTKSSYTTTGQDGVVLYQGGGQADADPTGGNSIPAAKQLNTKVAKNAGVVGNSEVSPEKDKSSLTEAAKAKAACMSSKLITIEFSSLGYTLIRPGIVQFKGIGQRYSGEYMLVSVTHTLGPNGYDCRGQGSSMAIYGESGVVVPDAKEGPESGTSDVQLYEPSGAAGGINLSQITNPSDIGSVGSDSFSTDLSGSANAFDEFSEIVLG